MEFSINRNIFLEEVSKAGKIIDPKNINPSISGVLIEAVADNLIIISTNGGISYKSVLTNKNSDLEIKVQGKTLIKTRYILDMLRKIEDEFIDIYMGENSELKIKTPKVEFNISTLNPEDYPLIGFREKGTVIEIDSKEFKNSINQTIISINEWNKKISLTGMNLKIDNKNLVISTTDMNRISQKTMNLISHNDDNNFNIIIPFKTVMELPKFIDGSNITKIAVSDGYATFIFNRSILQTTLIDGQFPNVKSVFPKEFNIILEVDSKKIIKTLSRADLPSDDGLASITNLKISKNLLVVRSNVIEIGNFEEEFQDFIYKGEEEGIVISFNSKFLQEAIKTFDGEKIEMKFISSIKPLVINKVSNNDLKQVILPTYLGE